MKDISSEENREKERHDKEYKSEEHEDLYIEPVHHEKLERINKHIHCYTYAMASVGKLQGKRLLDLGCGTGICSVILAKRGAVVEGIDISPVAVETAQKRAEINGVADKAQFKAMSFYQLDYPDEYFDIITGFSALHHAHDKKLFCESLFRVLKPGGIVVFNEPFGESRVLEKLRLLVPVEVQEEDKTHWDEQVKYSDLEYFKDRFKVAYREFQLLSRLDRIFKSEFVINILGNIDLMLLGNFPFLRRYARDIVIILTKTNHL